MRVLLVASANGKIDVAGGLSHERQTRTSMNLQSNVVISDAMTPRRGMDPTDVYHPRQHPEFRIFPEFSRI